MPYERGIVSPRQCQMPVSLLSRHPKIVSNPQAASQPGAKRINHVLAQLSKSLIQNYVEGTSINCCDDRSGGSKASYFRHF